MVELTNACLALYGPGTVLTSIDSFKSWCYHPILQKRKTECEVVHGSAVAEPGFKMRSLASQPLLSPTRGRSVVRWVQIRFPAQTVPLSQPTERGEPAKASHWALFRDRWAFPTAPVGRRGLGYDVAAEVLDLGSSPGSVTSASGYSFFLAPWFFAMVRC